LELKAYLAILPNKVSLPILPNKVSLPTSCTQPVDEEIGRRHESDRKYYIIIQNIMIKYYFPKHAYTFLLYPSKLVSSNCLFSGYTGAADNWPAVAPHPHNANSNNK
jgi:hypothetical protein